MSAADQVIQYAAAELGKPYVFGAEGPDTFDCSGLMQWIFAKVGIGLPRIADQQQRATRTVERPVPGDLVFYGNPASHVALYIGDGKMIHAPNRDSVVRIDAVYGSPTYGRVSGLGAITAPVVDAVGNVASGAGELLGRAAGELLGGARNLALETAFIGLGLALVGVGLWRASKPMRGK